MINGHGDDAYQYADVEIRSDFSSNISPQTDHRALSDHLASLMSRLVAHYPEPEAWSLERQLAERLHIAPEQVIVTSGATEAIYLVAQAFRFRPVIPTPTFSEYADACALYPPLDTSRSVLWLCNPNNPTGEVTSQSTLQDYIRCHDLIVIDQSYEDYTDLPMLTPQKAVTLDNVIQIHSLTKTYAVPGLRLGYLTASASLTAVLRRYLRPWSVSAPAVEAGRFLLAHNELRLQPDLAEARRLCSQLQRIKGISVQPTQTSFMLCRCDCSTAARLKDYLVYHHGLLIRDASNFSGLSPHHFRVAARTAPENDALVKAINLFVSLCS